MGLRIGITDLGLGLGSRDSWIGIMEYRMRSDLFKRDGINLESFREKFGTPLDLPPPHLTLLVRVGSSLSESDPFRRD